MKCRADMPAVGRALLVAVLLLSFATVARASAPAASTTATTVAGKLLGVEHLFDPKAQLATPLPTEAFTPLANLQPTRQRFEGRLRLTASPSTWRFVVRREHETTAVASRSQRNQWPVFDFEFVQDGNELIPVQRGPQRGTHPVWEFVLEPGRVWDLPEDGGYSRASLPFSLQQKNQNCLHNGLLTFVFGADGRISRAAVQIGSETCAYLQFDAWGMLNAEYLPGPVASASEVVSAHRAWRLGRLPQRPLEQLADDHPGADPRAIGSDISTEDLTVRGLVIDGIHYVGGCMTRYGLYPYCDSLDLPSYSLAKSLFGGLGLMRLELIHPGAARSRIVDHVPECAASPAWQDVTLLQALDMATGAYRSPAYEVDEDADHLAKLLLPLDHAHKIRYACTFFTRQAPPGTRWVYHTSDTYVLGTAMQSLLRKTTDTAADTYRDLLVTPIWMPMGLSATSHTTRRTYDAVAQPFTGWGLTLLRDDFAKLAQFLQRGATIDGVAVVDPVLLAEALQQVPAARGLPAGAPAFRYQHGFWARDIGPLIGCREAIWVPFLSGFGGISLVLYPNGISSYAVSDGGVYDWARTAVAVDRLRPMCVERVDSRS